MQKTRLFPSSSFIVDVQGLLFEKHLLACSDIVSCSIHTSFLSKPYIVTSDGQYYIASYVSGITRFWLLHQLESPPSFIAFSLSFDAPFLIIQCLHSCVNYKLSAYENTEDETETVYCKLEEMQNCSNLLKISLPKRRLWINKPLETVLVAFCYFLSIDSLHYMFLPKTPPIMG